MLVGTVATAGKTEFCHHRRDLPLQVTAQGMALAFSDPGTISIYSEY